MTVPAFGTSADPEQQRAVGSRSTSPGQIGSGQTTQVTTRVVPRSEAESRIVSKLTARIPRVRPKLGANFSIRVTDAATGGVIFDRRPNRPLLPASNMKVITAVDALTILGPDATHTTKVKLVGQGAVALVGSGDATLSDTQLDTMAKAVAAAIPTDPALTPAPGLPFRVLYDDSLFFPPGPRTGWPRGYSPGVVRPVTALGRLGRYVSDPSHDAATYFVSRLRAYGVTTGLRGKITAEPSAPLVTQSTGATLRDQVNYMLQVSENNIAENLFYEVAAARGFNTTWRGGRLAAMETLGELGVPTNDLNLTSGSGVGRNDRVTPRTLAALMSRIADSAYPKLNSIYYGGSLPLAGRSGTLSASTGRYTTAPSRCAAGKVSAKTGTLHDVVALSGLTVGTDGRLKAFSIIDNNRPEARFSPLQTRRAVDALVATINGCY